MALASFSLEDTLYALYCSLDDALYYARVKFELLCK